jgi:uncharacterized membrane protein required for colicin V production
VPQGGEKGMNWLDYFFLAIIVWCAWKGLATGLIAGVFRLAGVAAGLVAALRYAAPLAGFAERQLHLEEKLQKWFFLQPAPGGRPEGVFAGALPQAGTAAGQGGAPPLTGFFAYLPYGLLEIVSFILIFAAVSGLVSHLGRVLATGARWAFLGPADRLGGLILGVLQGTAIVLVLLALFGSLQAPAFSLPGGAPENFFARALKGSALVPFFGQILAVLKMLFPGLPLRTAENFFLLAAFFFASKTVPRYNLKKGEGGTINDKKKGKGRWKWTKRRKIPRRGSMSGTAWRRRSGARPLLSTSGTGSF